MVGRIKRAWKRRLVRWGVIVLGAFMVLSVVAVEATSTSTFCGTACHIMDPFYKSWQTSAHADVECVKCHIPPGVNSYMEAKLNGLGQVVDDALNRTSTKPSASVSQMACLRSGCHSLETLSAVKLDNDVFMFAHGKHVGKEYYGIAIGCTTCHSHVKGDEHFEVNTGVCINCHLVQDATNGEAHEDGVVIPAASVIRLAVREGHDATPLSPAPEGRPPASCRTCHNPPSGPFDYHGLTIDHAEYLSYGASCESCHRGATAAPAPIDDDSCLSCHVFGVERSLPTEEMHRVHSEGKHKIECFSCHGTIRHGPTAQTMALEQLDCRQCHIDQHTIQQRTYLTEAPAAHTDENAPAVSPMFLAHVDCTGCHVEPTPLKSKPGSGARVARPTPQACDACHQPGLGEQMIPLWQNAARRLYDQAMLELVAFEGQDLSDQARGQVDRARSLIDLVRMDGSWGVHNPRYTQSLLEQAREAMAEARRDPASGGGG